MKIKALCVLSAFLMTATASINAQNGVAEGYIYSRTDGTFLIPAYIDAKGDTILYMELREIEIKAPRVFATAEDYKRWERYKRYAPSVIPYAVDAVKTYRQLEAVTRDKSSRDRKKYINELEGRMEKQLRFQMKNLTVTQGFLLIEMIEKELNMPFFDLVKDVKGNFAAFYWNEFSKMYNYQLKDIYTRGKDPILDSVLDQFDLSYYLN
jgi:Domain of unknown function (DUF4294)